MYVYIYIHIYIDSTSNRHFLFVAHDGVLGLELRGWAVARAVEPTQNASQTSPILVLAGEWRSECRDYYHQITWGYF